MLCSLRFANSWSRVIFPSGTLKCEYSSSDFIVWIELHGSESAHEGLSSTLVFVDFLFPVDLDGIDIGQS